MSNQNDIERIIDLLERDEITTEQANIQMVRNERFRLITKLHADVRKALNTGVKNGELGHMKKEKFKPEVYYHPDFKYLAIEARNKAFNNGINALKSICI